MYQMKIHSERTGRLERAGRRFPTLKAAVLAAEEVDARAVIFHHRKNSRTIACEHYRGEWI